MQRRIFYQGWRSGFGKISDPGLCTPNDRRYLKYYWIKILEILQAFFLFSYFLCHTFSVSRWALDPVRILPDPDPGWFSGSRASMERLTQNSKNTKRRNCKFSRKLFQRDLNIFLRSGPRAPDPDPETGFSSLYFTSLVKMQPLPS